MHYLDISGGFLWRNLSTLNGQLECTVSGVGASENSMKLNQKGKHTGRTNIHETYLRAIQVFNDQT